MQKEKYKIFYDAYLDNKGINLIRAEIKNAN